MELNLYFTFSFMTVITFSYYFNILNRASFFMLGTFTKLTMIFFAQNPKNEVPQKVQISATFFESQDSIDGIALTIQSWTKISIKTIKMLMRHFCSQHPKTKSPPKTNTLQYFDSPSLAYYMFKNINECFKTNRGKQFK